MKRLCNVLIVLLIGVSMYGYGPSYDFVYDNLQYRYIQPIVSEDTSVAIVGVVNKDLLPANLVIPDSIYPTGGRYTIRRIERGAFSGCYGLTSVRLPTYSLEYLGDRAFYDCYRLKTIDFGQSVDTIGYIFHYCDSITELHFPASVRYIETDSTF